jgi:hypothetical protein
MKNNKIVAEPNTKLNVFFPTEVDTNLNFYINGQFDTPPMRATIYENEKSQYNRILWDEIYKLYDASLIKIKNQKLIDINFLNILPIGKYYELTGRSDFYREFWKKWILSLPSVITISGRNEL